MKTIELIDKYIIKQNDDTEYNPPSYIWTDNTGEIVRCRDCIHVGHDIFDRGVYCNRHKIDINDDDYCSYGKRKGGDD